MMVGRFRKQRGLFMPVKRKICGLISISVGIGILLALFVPAWIGVAAVALIAFGVWNLFFC